MSSSPIGDFYVPPHSFHPTQRCLSPRTRRARLRRSSMFASMLIPSTRFSFLRTQLDGLTNSSLKNSVLLVLGSEF
jgi:hypothetical protein